MKVESTAPMTLLIVVFGLLSVAAFALIGGLEHAKAAAAGSLLAVANWLTLKWTVSRMFGSAKVSWAIAFPLMMVKLALLTAVLVFLVNKVRVPLLPFASGLFSLVLGVILGSALRKPESTLNEVK